MSLSHPYALVIAVGLSSALRTILIECSEFPLLVKSCELMDLIITLAPRFAILQLFH